MGLLPRDQRFFELFIAVAERSVEAARQLEALLKADPDRRNPLVDSIKRLEHEGDEITHEVITRLDRSFITPLDREDIHALASGLDDVIDLIDGLARRARMSRLYLPNADHVPFWVEIGAYTAISLGTALGGWRIVKTMGSRITPFGGFCAETAGGITMLMASAWGIPVSTTHTITGAIVGVGASNRISAVGWGVAGTIVWAWVLTMPMSAAIAGLCYLLLR